MTATASFDAALRDTFGPRADEARDRMDVHSFMGRLLRAQLFAYRSAREYAGGRLLDFGCGYGASTFILAALLPGTRMVGVDLDATRIAQATRLAAHLPGEFTFHASPSGTELPPNLGRFDVIMLSAVYEHLLPEERSVVLPRLWAHLRVGGLLFVNQTPHRWFPYDHHSTGLWGINYLPAPLAARYAHRYARMNRDYNRAAGHDWPTHLRGGLRGGTERSILRHLTLEAPGTARILQPSRFRDRADYWLHQTSPRYRPVKRLIAHVFRLSERLCGTIPSMNVDVVLQRVA